MNTKITDLLSRRTIIAIIVLWIGTAIAIALVLNLNSALALELANAENERYTIQINDFGCEITDYDVHLDLWHLTVAGSYTVTLNNSGDTEISIRWNDGDDTQKEMIIPAKTVKKYSINFSFHLLSRDFSYEYEEI